MPCDCQNFPAIPLERKVITKRIKESKALKKRLQVVAEDKVQAIALYRCPVCGEMWQSGREWHFANEEYLFRVPPIATDDWLREHYQQPAAMFVFSASMHSYLERAKFVPSVEKCLADGCEKRASSIGSFCQEHQIQDLQKRGQLAKPPVGRLFPPYYVAPKNA